MYKLFLCLKYLRKRALAYFAVFSVFLCVAMMLICVSVLNGFVDKIEQAAKGLFGDVVISSTSLGGLAYYDEFIAEMNRQVPAVEGASPFILTFGILRVPGTDYRRTVQIAGIRLPERADVSDFEEGLFVQRGMGRPTFDPPRELLLRRLEEEYQVTTAILDRVTAGASAGPSKEWQPAASVQVGAFALALILLTTVWVGYDSTSKRIPTGWEPYSSDAVWWVLFCAVLWIGAFPYYLVKRARILGERKGAGRGRLRILAGGFVLYAVAGAAAVAYFVWMPSGGRQAPQEKHSLAERIRNALSYQEMAMANLRSAEASAQQIERLRKQLEVADRAGDDAEVRRLDRLVAALEHLVVLGPRRRAILGLGIPGLTSRTERGETIRTIGPGQQVVLSLIPLGGRLSYTDITPVTTSLTVIDDCSTDVSSIDSEIVYVDFEALQGLSNMGAEYAVDDPNLVVVAGRCSQVHVKVRPAFMRQRRLEDVARQIDRVWLAFRKAHPDAARSSVQVETWRQRQSRLVSSIEAQRTLMVIILGIISSVAIVLIFVIMYVTVVQKTRDIGVLKAVGASSAGVAGIFLGYGAAIGLVGSILGAVGGYAFVRNINPIHDWIGRTFGLVVWSRETFMFEKIPNEVNSATIVTIVVGAVLSGVLGSLVPSVLAACKQPVEALRYE